MYYNPKIKYSKSYIEVYDRDKVCEKIIAKNIYYKEEYIYEKFSGEVQKVKLVDKETKNMNKRQYIKYKLKHLFNTVIYDWFYFVIFGIIIYGIIFIFGGGKR